MSTLTHKAASNKLQPKQSYDVNYSHLSSLLSIQQQRRDYPHCFRKCKHLKYTRGQELINTNIFDEKQLSSIDYTKLKKQCDQFHIHCDDGQMENCSSFWRLKRLMENYIHFCFDVDCVDIQLITDDFLHLLHEHDTLNEFEFIVDSFGYCDIKTCYIFTRHYRQRGRINSHRSTKQISYEDIYDLLNDNNDNKEDNAHQIASMQILDTIHCYFCHTFDIGFRSRIKFTNSRFLCNGRTTKTNTDEFDESMLDINDIDYDEINKEISHRHRVFYDKFANQDITENNKYSNGIQVLTETEQHSNTKKDIKSTKKSKVTTKGNEPFKYSFGHSFVYDIHHKYNSKMSNSHCIRFVPMKHASFKDEIINLSQKADVGINQWMHQWKKAELHYNSYYCKAFVTKYNKTYNEVTDGYIKYELQIEHLLALMFYCNYDKLQYEFSKTYRSIHPTESKTQIASRHSHFYHLGKWLKEAVHRFGTRLDSKDSHKIFYHGISQQTIFSSASHATFNGPLSTSIDYSVAACFANQSGLIVELSDDQSAMYSSSKYFAMHWLSCYANEHECLFIACDGPLLFRNIVCVKTGTQYRLIIKALHLLDHIFNDNKLIDPLNEEEFVLTQSLLHQQLNSCGMKEYDVFKSLDEYAKSIINAYCQSQDRLWINLKRLRYHDMEWMAKLFCCMETENEWIDLKMIHTLFPNIECVNVVWNVKVNMFILDDILKHLQRERKKARKKKLRMKLRLIKIAICKRYDDDDDDAFDIKTAIDEYQDQFEAMGFVMHLRANNTDLCIERLSVNNYHCL